jgi:hypothetical protein
MRRAAAPVLASTLLILMACTSSTATSPSPSGGTSVTIPPDASSAVDAVMTEASTHLGVSRDQVHVDQVQAQQWPDSSLGCPQPGQLYSQIVTPGFLVMISAGGKQLEYHTDDRSRVMLCRES